MKKNSFETSIKELEDIVDKLESGDINLEENFNEIKKN